MSDPVDRAHADRFAADLNAIAPEIEGTGKLALAVSGGPDSMALLALGEAAFPGRVIAATVDHGLRPEAAAEAASVAHSCAGIGVAHATLTIATPKRASGNLHAWARQERYNLLLRWAADAGALGLCTAHHADDQAETFLMRAARGAGLSGLAAVRPRIDSEVEHRSVTLLRPLLGWRRAELRAIADAAALPFVDDPSNVDPRFDRARFRAWLAQAPWLDAAQVARAAGHVTEADADMLAVSHWFWRERARPSREDEARLDVACLPRGVRRYLARIAIDWVATANGLPLGGPDRVGNIEPLLDALEAGRGATHAGVQASARGDLWHFREAPPRRTR